MSTPMRTLLSSGLLAAVLTTTTATSLAAQSLAPGHLVGWAQNTGPLAVCSAVYTQDVEGSCQRAVIQGSSLCTGKGAGAGGTAYDPRMKAAWVSNGDEIALHDIASKTILCKFTATRGSTGYAVSGLALSDARRELFQLEVGPGILAISSYDVTSPCNPVHNKNWCRVRITGTSATARSLAYDEVRDLLYFTTSISGFGSWLSFVNVVTWTAPCVTVSQFGVANCAARPGNPVTGLGYDSCTQRLYATDGLGTRVLLLIDPAKGVFRDLTGANACCQFSGTGRWQGLAVVPNWTKKEVGKSCLDSGCGTCTGTKLDLVGGDASLGNKDFGLKLSGAPVNSQGLFFISIGNCSTGVSIPGLCGPIHVSLTPPFPALVGSFATTGSTTCTAKATVVLGIPADAALCKVSLCTQWLVLCQGSGNPSGLTNAVEFTIGG